MGAIWGILLHAIGGLASGSFYVPFKRVRKWSWESYWLAAGFFSWLIAPWFVAWLTVPNLGQILAEAPADAKLWCFIFGMLWGIGGLTFGLTIRYLGLSLGMAVAIGFCAAFGTIIPPIYKGQMGELLSTTSGLVTLAGVLICLVGIGICGWAGVSKERELPEEEKKASIAEFSLKKGLIVATFSGIMSSCFAFGIEAGEPIAKLSVALECDALWSNGAVLIYILLGGFTLNFVACVFLNIKNKSARDYIDTKKPMLNNYIFSALAGIIWYEQFMFYGMGTSYLGDYKFASWSLHMSFIVVFSTLWGIYFKEWSGVSTGTRMKITVALLTVIGSTVIIGWGSYLGA